jgi:hypothetical protein
MTTKIEQTKQVLGIKDRVLEAIIRRIEGTKDIKKKFDYIMNPEKLSSSARLSESQVQAVSETQFLAAEFPTLQPLADFTKGYAEWSISRDGKGREEIVTVMVSENKTENLSAVGLPMLAMQNGGSEEKSKDGKKGKEKEKE